MMTCPNCNTLNRDNSKFCVKCGKPMPTAPAPAPPAPASPPAPPTVQTPMAQTCLKCGLPNQPTAKFCSHCGQKMVSRPGTGNLAPNTMIANRFLIVDRIAAGGQGAVYLVFDTHLMDPILRREKPWALKEMSQSMIMPSQLHAAVRMFQREAAMLAHLEHTNLPRVIDCFEHDGKHYLVMDYIKGETLERMLQNRATPFRLDELKPMARQLIGVLMYLHSQNPPIIYRDLKPGNIMRDQRGTLKLIDFGIARFKHTTQYVGSGSGELTTATPGYAPPEQLRGGEVGPTADVYALGVTLHQLLTKVDPTQIQLAFHLPLASDANPQVPRPVAEMLARAYEPDLQKRIATMRDFEHAFEQALRDAGAGSGVQPNAPRL